MLACSVAGCLLAPPVLMLICTRHACGCGRYPVERTLLVTGAIDLVMQSRSRGGAVLATPPELATLTYSAPAKEAIRPSAELPVGASTVPFEVEQPVEWVLVPKL